jgi:hypothetical protein
MMREFFNGVNNFRDQMRDHVRAERAMPDGPAQSPDRLHIRQTVELSGAASMPAEKAINN